MTNLNDANIHAGIDGVGRRADNFIERTPLNDDQKDSLHRAASSASDAAHDATDAAGIRLRSARDGAGRVIDRLSDQYEERPLPILAIAVGVLALVGVIALATRSRD